MGEAILAAMLGKKLAVAKDITVSDIVETATCRFIILRALRPTTL